MPTRWRPSVTVAAIVSRRDPDAMRWLLVEEARAEGLLLNNPAGHLEPGEAPVEGAVREALEETACVFTPDRLLGVYLSRAAHTTFVRFAFGGTVGAPDPSRALDEGIVRTVWLTLEEVRASAARHRSPLVLRCIEDDAAGKHHPLSAVTTHASVFEEGSP